MPTVTENPAVETKTEAVKPVVKKDSAAKPNKNKATKKAPAKKAAKSSKNGEAKKPRAKKKGLRKSQVAILKALAKAKKPLTRPELAEAAEVDASKIGVFVGPRAGESAKTSATWPFPGLFELGFVKVEKHEGQPTVNEITAKGRKALEGLKG